MSNIESYESRVTYVQAEDKCDSRIIAWYYLRYDGLIYFRPQAPGVEGRLKETLGIAALWPWDGSWSNWWQMLIEAYALGVSASQLKKLAAARGCDNKNAILFGKNFGITLYVAKERHWASIGAVKTKGGNYLEALGNLCIKLGYVGSKESTLHFLDLVKSY